jgi:uncharacterized protein
LKLTLMNTAAALEQSGNRIVITAPAATDNFIDMYTRAVKFDAPYFRAARSGDFVARCTVEPGFAACYDAGGIIVYESRKRWIKFEFEMTDLGYASAVSVATDGVSDDCNGERIDAESARLQIARRGDTWCLHYATGTSPWKMVRYFHFEMKRRVKVGISAQSPVGNGCRVVFRDFELLDNTCRDMRKGE